MGLAERFTARINKNPIWRVLLGAEKIVMVVCSILPVFGVCYNVITRYILHKNFFGMDDVLMVLMITMYFWGAGYASFAEEQISADIVTSLMKSERKITIMRVIQNILSTVVCLIYAKWFWDYVAFNFTAGSRTPVMKMPYWIPQSAIFVAFALMFLYHLYHSVEKILQVMDKKREGKEA
ncbi:MAG: TRAP transporter small permease [Lachnospiraceae bacterium]|nr:TRAP transporter small permease [Lachnospiraceae bacterium]